MTEPVQTRNPGNGTRRAGPSKHRSIPLVANAQDIVRALKNDEFEPFFQPFVVLRTGRLTGFEILARWRHPALGLLPPANFISLADQSGLVGKLMEQILRKAFLSASLFPEPLGLSINVSPTQLQNLNLANQIRKAAAQSGFALSRLTVEITESAIINNLNRARIIAVELKSMGCRLALDDFGTGYSSLTHLQALPFDELKIDRSFVASMTKIRESQKIVAATIDFGHSLGLTTVAEGVVSEQQADMLVWLGCEFGQGWLFGKAIPTAEVSAIVAAPARAISHVLSTSGDAIGMK